MASRQATWTTPERVDWVRQRLPDHLLERLEHILGGRDGLDAVLSAESRPALRINTLKANPAMVLRRLHAVDIQTTPVAWSDTTVFIDDEQQRPLGQMVEHQMGHFFLHDAASALPVLALDPQPGENILDLCAAPGGKTTHILARMNDEGLVVANDPRPQRVNHLVSTLDRLGGLSCIVTQRDGRHAAWPVTFDRVLVDAPCTNLGGIHHSPGPAFKQHKDTRQRHVRLQRRLLMSAAHATRPGGTIVYATCTLDPMENEENAAWFAQQPGIAIEPHGLPLQGRGPGDTASPPARDVSQATLRIHPGDHHTDGFFIARFTRLDAPLRETPSLQAPTPDPRKGQTAPEPAGTAPIQRLIEHNGLDPTPWENIHALTTPTRIWATNIDPETTRAFAPLKATRIGQLVANRETPGPRLHFDAATRFGHNAHETIELTPQQARAWLSGNPIEAPPGTPGDQHRVIMCNDEPIGAARAYGDKIPCFVPKHRRVPDDPALHGWLAAPRSSPHP